MSSNNDGPRIESLSSMVGGKTPTTPQKASSAAHEKGAFDDVDSVYDEEEIPATRESDFKHKQVCRDNTISSSLSANQLIRSSKAGAYSCE